MAARALLALMMLLTACTDDAIPNDRFWPFTPARADASMPGGAPIRVGAVFSTSGGIKWVDTPGLNGFRLAADEINATGGLLGRPVEVVHVDAATHPLSTVEAIEAMIAQGVVALGGLLEPTFGLAPLRGAVRLPGGGLVSFDHSSVMRFVAPVAARAGIPLVSAGSTAPEPGVVLLSAGFDRLVRAALDHARETLDARTAWLLTDDGYRYTASMAAGFRRGWEAGGGSILGEQLFAAGGARHIDEQLAAIRGLDAPPDVILLAAVPNELGIVMDEIRGAGIDVPVVSAAGFDSPYIVAFAEQRADDLWLSMDASLLDPDPRIRTFAVRYERVYGRAPEHLGAMQGYDAMRLIAAAIERAGRAEPAAIGEQLDATRDFPILGGTVRSAARGVPRREVAIVRAESGVLRFETRR